MVRPLAWVRAGRCGLNTAATTNTTVGIVGCGNVGKYETTR